MPKVDLGAVVLEKKTLKIWSVDFRYFLSLEKDMGLRLNKIKSPSPNDALPNLIEIGPLGLEPSVKVS